MNSPGSASSAATKKLRGAESWKYPGATACEGLAMNESSGFKYTGAVVALSIAVIILILGLLFGFGRILWILSSAAVLLIGVGVFAYFAEKSRKRNAGGKDDL